MSTNDTLDVDDGDISIFHLRRAVVNEMNSPELLTYEQDVMDHFLTLLKEKEDIGDNVSTEQEKKIVDIFRLDSERVKYYLQLYHRARIFKIDKYHVSLLATDESLLRLSEPEQRYAKNYKKILNRHMMDSFLKDIPQGLRGTEDVRSDVNMVPEPNLETPVFCRVISDIGEVTFEPGADPVDMKANSTYVLKYRYIRPFLVAKQLELL